jgi:chromosome segregation ATPase
MPDPVTDKIVCDPSAGGGPPARSPEDQLRAQIEALVGNLLYVEAQMRERDRLLAQANTQLARMTSRRDVFREMAKARETEAAILRVECDRLRAELEARDDQVLRFEGEVNAAVTQVQRLSRAKEAFALALHERERVDAERLERARDEIQRLKSQGAKDANDSRVAVALMERSWAEEIPADRPAA